MKLLKIRRKDLKKWGSLDFSELPTYMLATSYNAEMQQTAACMLAT